MGRSDIRVLIKAVDVLLSAICFAIKLRIVISYLVVRYTMMKMVDRNVHTLARPARSWSAAASESFPHVRENVPASKRVGQPHFCQCWS